MHPNEAAKQVEIQGLQAIVDNIQKSGRGVRGSVYGWNLLHHFSYEGDLLAVELLLEKGCDPTGSQGQTCCPLHLAVLGSKEDIVQVLLEKGANVNIKDVNGDTPLTLATMQNCPTIVKLLLYWGADVEARNKRGFTALNLATAVAARKEVKHLLQQAKKDAAGKSK